MSDEKMITEKQEVTVDDVNLAVQVLADWHRQNDLSFAIVNTGSVLFARSGKPLALEAALRHAYEQIHAETAMAIHAAAQAAQHRQQAPQE